MHHEQDMMRMGALRKKLPNTPQQWLEPLRSQEFRSFQVFSVRMKSFGKPSVLPSVEVLSGHSGSNCRINFLLYVPDDVSDLPWKFEG